MRRIGIGVMIGLFTALGSFTFSPAQSGGGGRLSSNGHPDGGWVGAAADADLDRAFDLMEQDGHERDVIAICEKLLPSLEDGSDPSSLVDCLFLLGEAHYYLSDWSDAQQYMQRAWDLGNDHFADEMNSYPLKVIGECQFELGDLEASLATFRQRVALLKEQKDVLELPGALFDVGGMLVNLEREEEAIGVLTEALNANDDRAAALNADPEHATDEARAGTVVDHAEITYHLAIANYRLEHYEAARTFLVQAYNFFTSIKDSGQYDVSDRLVAVLDDLVLVSQQLGDNLAASRYQRERDALNQ
jgi:tetratricopeptide (TPR) repeat protein